MPEIEEEVTITFRAHNLKLDTSMYESTISIEGIQLSYDQAATIAYLINDPRNLLQAQIKLTGRLPS